MYCQAASLFFDDLGMANASGSVNVAWLAPDSAGSHSAAWTCPTTFERAAPIEVTNVIIGEETADASSNSATSEAAVQHTEGMVVTHPATGAMEPIAASYTAKTYDEAERVQAQIDKLPMAFQFDYQG